DTLQQARIALAGQLEVDLQKQGETWEMQAPLQWPADAALVQDFLDALADPASNSFPAQGADLGKYGLDKPLARFWLDGTEYDFGALQPISKQRYLLSGGRVYMVEGYLFARIAHDPYGWLDHHLFPAGAHIAALQLPHATLTQDARGDWQIAPADPHLDQAALGKFVEGWQAATARNVARFAKAKSDGEVAVVLAGVKDPLRFEILEDDDFLVLARPDLGFEYQLDIGQLGTLLTPAPAATTP
ncbi:MAG TPA: DUF4340 domain-containing protein, partial [Gammaproteobacteria bacterium]